MVDLVRNVCFRGVVAADRVNNPPPTFSSAPRRAGIGEND
jgi:hypothetical protein